MTTIGNHHLAQTLTALYANAEDQRQALLTLVAKGQVGVDQVPDVCRQLGIPVHSEKAHEQSGTAKYAEGSGCTTTCAPMPKSNIFAVRSVPADCEPPARQKTRTPPAAIGSTSHSIQTTGSTAARLEYPKKGLVYAWVVPGSTVRVHNPAIRDANGQPSLITEVTAPNEIEEQVRNISPSYPAADQFAANLAKFNQVDHAGLTAVPIELPCDDSWDARDILHVTQETDSRSESDPVAVRLVNYNGPADRDREGFADFDAMKIQGGRLFAPEGSLPPDAFVSLSIDGFALKQGYSADEHGGLEIELPEASGQLTINVAYRASRFSAEICTDGVEAVEPERLPADRADDYRRSVRDALLRAPENGKLDFCLHNLPDGFQLKISNPASGDVETFTSKGGRLDVELDGVQIGDSLLVEQDISKVDEQFERSWIHKPGDKREDGLVLSASGTPQGIPVDKQHVYLGGHVSDRTRKSNVFIEGHFIVPDVSEQSRIETVLSAVCDLTEAQQQVALQLFGPFGSNEDLACEGVSGIRDIMQGVITGSVVGNLDPKLTERVEANASSDFARGFALGTQLRAKGEIPFLAQQDEVGLTRTQTGKLSRVITGGHSYFGKSSPLRPETVRSPDHYTLELPNGQSIDFKAGGYGPSGTINRNAIGITFSIGPMGRP